MLQSCRINPNCTWCVLELPKNIVQSLPEPISKEDTNELSNLVDLIVATGSQNNIQRALQSGTPTLGVGVGNVPSIIDESARS